MKKWFAICPKCEKFNAIPNRSPEWYCAHSKETSFNVVLNDYEMNNTPELETLDQIKCKVIKL